MSEVLSSALLVGGVVLSLYQGYRGFMFQWLRTDIAFPSWSKCRKVILLSLADGLTYFVTSASGIVSLVVCWKLWARISGPSRIEVGTAALFGFLMVYGIFGVTGKMPYLIDRGKLFTPSLGG
jgi:heme A synthase